MLEVTFNNDWCAHRIGKNVLNIAHGFNYGNITEKIPEYDDYVKAVKDETEIRVWYSNSPMELSGFYWFCKLLADIGYEGKLYTEKSAKTIDGRNVALTDEDVQNVINNRNLLSSEEIKSNNLKWEKLCAENSDFRIVKDDELISDIPDASDDLTVSEKTVLKIMRDLDITTSRAGRAAVIIGTALYSYPKITSNDDVTFKIIKKLAGYANPYIELHYSKKDESCSYRYCECMFTELGRKSLQKES